MSKQRLDQQNATASRRTFLKTAGAVTAGTLAGSLSPKLRRHLLLRPTPLAQCQLATSARPGYRVCIFSLGGQAAIEQPNNEAVAMPIIDVPLDLGVNYMDTAAMYGGRERSSRRRYIGQVMKRRRSQVYLASKTHDRTRDGSLELLEESLKLLDADHLDAWQLHHIDRREEVEQIFGKGGAIEALIRARERRSGPLSRCHRSLPIPTF